MNKIKAVFIDRDGTINEERQYVSKIEDFKLIPGSLEALKLLTENGIKIYIITNQGGIAKGFFTIDQFHHLTEHMINHFESEGIKIEKVLYCPHHPDGIVPEYAIECSCRKPSARLLEDVIEENNYQMDEIALVGDKNTDIEAGKRLGIRTFLVETGYGIEEKGSTKATFIKKNLKDAVNHVLNLKEGADISNKPSLGEN